MSPRFRHLLALPLLLVAAPSCNKEGASGKASSSSTSIDGGVASPLGSVPTGDTASGSPLPEATGPSFEGALTMHVTSTLHEPQDITMVTKANKVRVDIPMKNGKAVHSIFDPATGKALVIIDSEKLAMTTVVPAAADMPDLGAPPTVAMALAGFGAHVGLAFQLTDDLLGIWGAPEVTGKPVRADLRARKKSLPVVAALNSGTPAAAELRAMLTDPQPPTEDDLIRAADLVVAAGGKDWAETEADAQLAAANASLADIDLAADVRAELTAIAEFITARQW